MRVHTHISYSAGGVIPFGMTLQREVNSLYTNQLSVVIRGNQGKEGECGGWIYWDQMPRIQQAWWCALVSVSPLALLPEAALQACKQVCHSTSLWGWPVTILWHASDVEEGVVGRNRAGVGRRMHELIGRETSMHNEAGREIE